MKKTKRVGVFFNGGKNNVCDYDKKESKASNIYKLYIDSGHDVLCHELLKKDSSSKSDKDSISLILAEIQNIIESFGHLEIKVDVYSFKDGFKDSLDFVKRINACYSQTEYSNILGYIRSTE